MGCETWISILLDLISMFWCLQLGRPPRFKDFLVPGVKDGEGISFQQGNHNAAEKALFKRP